jgi:hypothetical protein
MKSLLFLLFVLASNRPPEKIMLVDTRLNAPVTYTDQFTTEDLFKKKFPVYASEVPDLVEATKKLARLIDQGRTCDISDTVRTLHSLIVLNTNCWDLKTFTVLLKTRVEGTSVSFPLVWKEANKRKAQTRLIDFTAYLTR